MGKALDTGLRWRVPLGLSAGLVAGQYAWNAVRLPPLWGYDAPGHAAFALSILRDGALPAPLSGWSTFHPPLYHLLTGGLWGLLEPLGAQALGAGLRSLGAVAWLGAGCLVAVLLRRLGARPGTALVAAWLFWLVPCNQLSAVMVGNESFGAALAASALWPLIRLQEDPADVRAALAAGCLAGAALATKFTGVWVAAACGVPFLACALAARFDRRSLRALAVCAAAGALVAGPVYVRNIVTTGTPLPMTRVLGPMKSAEDALTLRPRRVRDYVGIAPEALRRPSIYHVPDEPGSWARRNEAMANVWSLVYAGLWYDAHAHRVPIEQHRDDVPWGPLLMLLGLVPTGLILAGYAGALRACVRSRLRSRDAPLVFLASFALVSFVGFTWHAPSLAAAKASYLLPAAGPAAWFFARAVDGLRAPLRRIALGASLLAALAAGLVFTHGLVFESASSRVLVRSWLHVARQLPGARIDEAVRILYGLEEGALPPRGRSSSR